MTAEAYAAAINAAASAPPAFTPRGPMTVTINAVPESLTRSQFVDWLASVGIDPTECQSIVLDRNGIHATVYALNDDGCRYVNPGGDEIATHIIHVRIDDE